MDNSNNNNIQINNNINSNNDLLLSDLELERNIEILQNAIVLVKSERKKLDKETEIINKRINYLTQKEKQLKLHCKKQIDQLHKTVEIKKKRLQDEIFMEKKMNNNINNYKVKKISKKNSNV